MMDEDSGRVAIDIDRFAPETFVCAECNAQIVLLPDDPLPPPWSLARRRNSNTFDYWCSILCRTASPSSDPILLARLARYHAAAPVTCTEHSIQVE